MDELFTITYDFVLAGSMLTLIIWLHTHNYSLLNHKETRKKMREEVKVATLQRFYQSSLKKGLHRLDVFFGGQSVWSLSAFLQCFNLALFYALSLFFLSWGLGGNGQIGTVELLDNSLAGWQRGLFLVGFFVYMGLVVHYYLKGSFLALALAGGLAAALFYGNVTGGSIVIIVFWALFPLTNAVSDWLSWAISRYLGRLISNNTRLFHIVMHGLFDLIAGLAFLVLMTAFLSAALTLLDALLISENSPHSLDVMGLIETTYQAPFSSDGLWLSAMLLTTLVPTALHLMVVWLAVLTLATPQWLNHKVYDWLGQGQTDKRALSKAAFYYALRGIVAFALLILSGWFIFSSIAFVFSPVSDWLYYVALWTVEQLS